MIVVIESEWIGFYCYEIIYIFVFLYFMFFDLLFVYKIMMVENRIFFCCFELLRVVYDRDMWWYS